MSSVVKSLDLIKTPSPEIKKELNLIDSVKKLNALGLPILPVQVWLQKNK